MAADYRTLKGDVEFYSDRSDLTSVEYDRYFRIAMEHLNRHLRVPETVATLSLTGSDLPYTDSSYAIVEVISFHVTRSNDVFALQYLPYPKLKAIQANESGTVPKYYSIVGNTLHVAPAPASTDSFSVVYYAKQDDSLADGETNLYVTYYGSLCLYSMLYELYLGLHDNVRAAEWQSRRDALVAEANAHAWQRRLAASINIRNA